MIQRSLRSLILLASGFCAAGLPAQDMSPEVAKALALYKEGPGTDQEVIGLLAGAVKKDPWNEQATRLLALTYMRSGQFSLALEQLERALHQVEAKKAISPELLFCKARSLYEMKRYEESLNLLDVHDAFWAADQGLKRECAQLHPRVCARMAMGQAATTKGVQLDGYVVLTAGKPDWAALKADGDLGPFVEAASTTSCSRMVLLIPANPGQETSYCLLLDGASPKLFGAVSPKASHSATEIRSALGAPRPSSTLPSPAELTFEEGEIRTDDDKLVQVLKIVPGMRQSR